VNDGVPGKRSVWRRLLLTVAIVIPYMLPMFWMWQRTGYPDSLGVHIAARGKAGVFESWWYSYLLVERGNAWDIILFGYMWLPIIAFVGWLIWAVRQDMR